MPKITTQAIDAMQNYRKYDAEMLVSPVDKDNEEFYRQALLAEYQRQREYFQYPLIVQNEAQKVYALAQDGEKAGTGENRGVWTAYRGTSVASQASQCAIARVPELTDLKGSNNCCAITASALQAEISAQMGYDGANNLVQKITKVTPSDPKSLTSALYVCSSTTADAQYVHKGNRKTLNQLIASGDIKVGDAVSLRRGPTTKESSGCHAVTVADVQYNSKGEPISYTLHSNNGKHYETVSVSSKGHWAGSLPVEEYLSSQDYWFDKIKEETNELAKLSTEELEKRVAETQARTYQIIDDLHQTEIYALNHNYSKNISDTYMNDLALNDAWHARRKALRTTNDLVLPLMTNTLHDIINLEIDPTKIDLRLQQDQNTDKEKTKADLTAQYQAAQHGVQRKLDEYKKAEDFGHSLADNTNTKTEEKKEKSPTQTMITNYERA